MARKEGDEAVELTEQKFCEYCTFPGKYLVVAEDGDRQIFVDATDGFLRCFDDEYPGFLVQGRIRYCPMCGRKLP